MTQESFSLRIPLTAVVSDLNNFVEGHNFIPKSLPWISSAQLHDVIQNFRLKESKFKIFDKQTYTAITQLEC